MFRKGKDSMKKRIIIYLILATLILVQYKPVEAQTIFGDERIPAFNTANRIVKVALAEVGYKEGKNNYSVYGKWNGQNHKAWCGSFVSWCAHEAGVPTTSIKRYSDNCMAEYRWFKSQNRWKSNSYKPQPGDIVFLDTQYKYEHTGIVVKCEKGIVYTVEGNTSDMVKLKQYSVKDDHIIGYGIPEYDKAKTYAKDKLVGTQEVTLDSKFQVLVIGTKNILIPNVSPKTTVNTVVWTSTNPKICTVNTKGEIMGKNAGVAIVSVMITNGNLSKCKVTVKKAE